MRAPRHTVEEITADICRGRRYLREPVMVAVRLFADRGAEFVSLKQGRTVAKAARKARETTDRLQGLLRSLAGEELIRGLPRLHALRFGWLNPPDELRATISQLERTQHVLRWLERTRGPDPRVGGMQQACAIVALDLIRRDGLSPRELRRTASLLYEAATGVPGADLKRACVEARKWDASRKNRTKASQTN
jgi:hypothetical protein